MNKADLEYAKKLNVRIQLAEKCECGNHNVVRVDDRKQCIDCWEKEVDGEK